MKNGKINKDELDNVSGGGGVYDDNVVLCPSCEKSMDYNQAFIKEEKDGCKTIVYFKCPYCNHEWHS